jgi:hypothetical protein
LFLQGILLAVNLTPWRSFQQIPLRDAAACGVTELSHRCGFVREDSELWARMLRMAEKRPTVKKNKILG